MATTSPGDPRRARVAAAAVPGCQHVLAGGLPCQDAVKSKLAGDRVILAVADGHGDAEYAFSDEGARTAVSVAVDVLDNLLDRVVDVPEEVDPATLEADFSEAVKRRIAFEWNRRVKNHAAMVAARDSGAPFVEHVTGDWSEAVKPYGSTLLAAAFTKSLVVWLRLGDGEILGVAGGKASRMLAPAQAAFGQATFSLAMRSSVEHIQLRFDRTSCDLAVLATDGVCDQYSTTPTFEEEWGTGMLDRILTKGWTTAMLELPRHLATVARDGDDCAAALAWFAPSDEV